MLPIKRMISAYNFYKGNTVEYIVLHDVGALGQAVANGNYFQVERGASAHYFVDDYTIVQVVEDFNGAWHVGDGWDKNLNKAKYGIHNQNSVGIEMCLTSAWKVSPATQNNTVDLVRSLKAKYPNAKIVRHYDASRKNCPGSMSANNWTEWLNFKARCESTAPVAGITTYTVLQGDTLYRISKNTGVTVEKLKALNGLISNIIKTGQVLRLSDAPVATIPKPVYVAPPAVAPTPTPVSSAWKAQSGTFSPNRKINIRTAPNTGASIIGTYSSGESVRYDSYMNDGTYTWIHYISYNGQNRYMVCRMTGQAWGSFS